VLSGSTCRGRRVPRCARQLEPLRECGSGRELVERGFADDITMAAELDATRTCPILRDGAYVDRTSTP
jgi:2-phosphosulfolactate phosphatase